MKRNTYPEKMGLSGKKSGAVINSNKARPSNVNKKKVLKKYEDFKNLSQ